MKAILRNVFFCLVLLMVPAAFAQDADAYDEVSDTVSEKEADDDGAAYEENDSPKDLKAEKERKKREKNFGSSGNFFKDFLFGKQKYIPFDEVELATGTLTFGVKPRVAQMIYNPKTKQTGVQVHFQVAYHNIVFGEKERRAVIKAIDMYLKDFEGRRLIRDKNAKTRKIYGNGKCFVEWGTAKPMMTNYANTKIQYGYEFKKGSPYFCLIIKGAKNEQKEMGSYVSPECTEIQLYFTRVKAKTFASMLTDAKIDELHGIYIQMLEADSYSPLNDKDSYSESDDYTEVTPVSSEKEESAKKAEEASEKAEEASEQQETSEESTVPESAETETAE